MKVDIGKIGSLPLIIVGMLWTFVFGFGGRDYDRIVRRSIFSFDIMSTILIDISLFLICLAIWFPDSKWRIYLGRIGSLIWIALLGYPTLMMVGEPHATSKGFFLVYVIMMASTILVSVSLWKRKKEG